MNDDYNEFIADLMGLDDQPERKEVWSRHFAYFARELLWNPPVSHRGAPSYKKLSVFELAVAAGVLALVRRARRDARHKHALRGKTKAGYKRERSDFNKQAPSTIKVLARKASLLNIVGLSRGGKNVVNVPAALDRLLAPVRVGNRIFPPLLRRWSTMEDGRVKLLVNASTKWLPRREYDAVPLPLPTRSSIALALYLYLHGCDLREDAVDDNDLPSIRTATLYRRIGATQRRDLYRALAIVNRHMRQHNAPNTFDVVKLPGNELRFVLAGARIETERLERQFLKGKRRQEVYA